MKKEILRIFFFAAFVPATSISRDKYMSRGIYPNK